MRELNSSPAEKLEREMQQVTGRMNKAGAHDKESASDKRNPKPLAYVPRSRTAFKIHQTEAMRQQKRRCSYVPLKTTQMQRKQAAPCASPR
jgi:hypothetical protein